MKYFQTDWKARSLELIVVSVPGMNEDDAWLDSILDKDGWEKNALFEAIGMGFPRLDIASLANGISAKQLGCLIGQTHSLVNRLGSLFAVLTEAFRRYVESSRRLARLMDSLNGQVVPGDRAQWDRLRDLAELPSQFEAITRADLRELVQFRSSYRRAIGKVLELASKEAGSEAGPFFGAYAEAMSSPSVGDAGEFTTADRRISKIISVLLICGEELTRVLASVTELHRVLALMLPDQLTRDEESLEWSKQRKVIESVCRTLGLSIRGRGRPRKTIPKTK